MLALLAGLISGFVIAIPPGPVAAFTIETTLSKGKKTGMSVGLGVALVDMVFCLGILFASSAFLGWLFSITDQHPTATVVSKLVIITAILIYAVMQLFSKAKGAAHSRVHLEDRVKSSRPFIVGSATALSNAFNPTFLPSLTAILTTITAQIPLLHTSMFDRWMFVFGFGAGTYGWLHSLISFVARHHALVSPEKMLLIRRIGAIIFIAFALYLAWKIIA